MRAGYAKRGLGVLAPSAFSNGNAIVVTKQTAEAHDLETLSDLAKVSGELKFGAIPGFDTREDGIPLLERVYGMRFGSVTSYENGIKYGELLKGGIDAVYGFETDGAIDANEPRRAARRQGRVAGVPGGAHRLREAREGGRTPTSPRRSTTSPRCSTRRRCAASTSRSTGTSASRPTSPARSCAAAGWRRRTARGGIRAPPETHQGCVRLRISLRLDAEYHSTIGTDLGATVRLIRLMCIAAMFLVVATIGTTRPAIAEDPVLPNEEFPLLDQAAEDFADSLQLQEKAIDAEVVEAADGGLTATSTPPDAPAGPEYISTPQPVRVAAPAAPGDWAEYDLGDLGVIRFRLLGRTTPTSVDRSETTLVATDAWNGHADVVTLVSADQLEDFVAIDEEHLAASTQLRYEFQLPAGMRLEARESGDVVVVDSRHVVVFKVSEPTVQDELGAISEAGLSLDADEVVVDFAEAAADADGDLLVDPLFGQPGGGVWNYQVCGASGSCAVSSGSLPPGWGTAQSVPRFRFNANGGANYGMYIGAQTTTHAGGEYATLRWYPPSGNRIHTMTSQVHSATTNPRVQCRIEIGDAAGSPTAVGSYVNGSNVHFGGSFSPGVFGFAGIAMRTTSGANFSVAGNADAQRCWHDPSAGDYTTITVADPVGPDATPLYAQDQSGAGGSLNLYQPGTAPGAWYGPSSSVFARWAVTDYGQGATGPIISNGSGMSSYSLMFNNPAHGGAPAGSAQYNLVANGNLCPSPGGYGDQRPCPNSYDTNTGWFTLGSIPGLVTGVNTMSATYWDFSWRSAITPVSAFRYDEDAPYIFNFDGFWTPYVGASDLVEARVPGTLDVASTIRDAASKIDHWSVTVQAPGGTVSTLCSGTAGALNLHDFDGTEGDVFCPWAVAEADASSSTGWRFKTGIPEGLYLLRINVWDTAGNLSTSSNAATLDQTPPSVPSLSFAARPDGSVRTSWAANDAMSGMYDYALCLAPTPTSCDSDLNFTSKALGNHEDRWMRPRQWYGVVRATDNAGNESYSSQVPHLVSPTPPNAPGSPSISQVTGETALLTWTPSALTTIGQIDVAGYEVCVGATASWCDGPAVTSPRYGNWSEVAQMTTQLAAGTYWARVRAVDDAGGKSPVSAASAPFSIDGTPPVVSLTGIAQPSIRRDELVPMAASATDSSGVAAVTFQQRGRGEAWVDIASDDAPPFEVAADTSALASDGERQVRAIAFDPSGNSATSTSGQMCLDRARVPQPSNVQVQPSGSPTTAADVSWAEPAASAAVRAYVIERREGASGAWTLVARVPRGTPAVHDDLATSTSQYRVEAVGQVCTTKGRGTTYEFTVLDDQPVGYWRMDDVVASTMMDASGGAHDGSYVGSPALGGTGATSGSFAAQLNGSNQHASVPFSSALHVGDTFTVELWFKRSSTSTSTQILFDNGTDSVEAYLDNNRIHLSRGAVANVFTGSSSITDSSWHHLVWSKAGVVNAVYLDGSPAPGTYTNQTLSVSGGATYIGRNAENNSMQFAGAIDEVALYPSPLSAETVRGHYGQRAQLPTYQSTVLNHQPVGYWRMDDPATSTMADASGGARHGSYLASPTLGVTGATTGSPAAQFNGSTQGASVPFSSALHVGDTFSVELWFKRSAANPLTEILFDNGTNSAEAYFYDNRLHVSRGAVSNVFVGSSTITNSSWHHLVWSKAGSANTVYLDGSPAPGAYANQPLSVSSGPTYIGRNAEGDNMHFAGAIDEVALYPSALSAAAVQQHYGSGLDRPFFETDEYESARVGVEGRWSGIEVPLGAGALASINVAGGAMTVIKAFPEVAARELPISPQISFNSNGDGPAEPSVAGIGAGRGWRLALAGLDGSTGDSFDSVALEPLRASGSSLLIRDGDGTEHTFHDPVSGAYSSPSGTWLHVRDVVVSGEEPPAWAPDAAYAATRPDRVTFWYAASDVTEGHVQDGRLLGVTGRGGGSAPSIRAEYECVEIDDLSGDVTEVGDGTCDAYSARFGTVLKNRLRALVDGGGRGYGIGYFDEGMTEAESNRDGMVRSLTDPTGVEHRFVYGSLDGGAPGSARLSQVVEAAGTSVQRSMSFEHVGDDSSTRGMDESEPIAGVVDGRGARTRFRYSVVGDETVPRVVGVTDRVDDTHGHHETTLTYGEHRGELDGTTEVRDELGNTSTYAWDSAGRVVRSVSATGVRSRTVWTAQHQVGETQSLLAEDEAVTLTGTGTALLGQSTYVAGTEVMVRSAVNQMGTRYVEGVDYTISGAPKLLARTPASSIPSGSTVYVSYVHATTTGTWDPLTGYPLTTRTAAPQRVDSSGIRIAPTTGELAPATVTTYTNVGLGGHVADVEAVTTPRGTATTGDPDDFRTTYTYDAHLRVASVSEPINKATGDLVDLATRTYQYYSDGTLKSEVDAKGVTRGFSNYDPSGEARFAHASTTGAFDPATTPVETVTNYDAMGRPTCVDQKLEAGDSVSTPWDDSACQFSSTNKTFDTTSYDALGRVDTVTGPWDATRRRASKSTHDANDNVVSSRVDVGYTPGTSTPTAPDSGTTGSVTTATYDELDRAVTALLPANDDAGTERRSSVEYDAADRLVREVQPQGSATENKLDYTTWHQYDAAGREIRTMNGNGEVTCSWYDRLGRLVASSQPMAIALEGSCPAMNPDGSGLPATFVERTEYDRAGNAIAVTDVTGRITRSYFDDEGNSRREEEAVTNPATVGAATSAVADPEGDAIEVTAPAVEVCTDAVACASTASTAATETSRFDGEGDLVSETDAREGVEGAPGAHETQYHYDEDGGLTRTDLPAAPGEVEAFQHTVTSALGDVVATSIQTDATTTAAVDANEQAQWAVQPDGSITGKADAATGTTYTATYGVNGQIATKTEHGVQTSWFYHPDGSLEMEVQRKLAPEWTANRTYAVGECVKPVAAAGLYTVIGGGVSGATEPTWPPIGQVTAAGVTYKADSCIVTTRHSYDRNGQEREVARESGAGNARSQVVRRDNVGRILHSVGFHDDDASAHDIEAVTTTTRFDRNGNKVVQINNNRTTAFSYGSSGATSGLLVSEALGYVDVPAEVMASFSYDAAGRLSAIVRGEAASRLRSDLRYDAAGNMTALVSCRQVNASELVPERRRHPGHSRRDGAGRALRARRCGQHPRDDRAVAAGGRPGVHGEHGLRNRRGGPADRQRHQHGASVHRDDWRHVRSHAAELANRSRRASNERDRGIPRIHHHHALCLRRTKPPGLRGSPGRPHLDPRLRPHVRLRRQRPARQDPERGLHEWAGGCRGVRV